jgi:hypothetical protein
MGKGCLALYEGQSAALHNVSRDAGFSQLSEDEDYSNGVNSP